MADIARGVLVGRLTRDPELNESGKVLTLGVAVNRRVKDRDGNYVDEVSFFDCKVLGNRASALGGFLTKGRQVAIDARIVQERWTSQEGHNRSKVVFIADEVVPLGGKDDAPAQSTSPREVDPVTGQPDDDPIPY